MKLTDKVIAITGAGRGLGRSMALHLAEKGAHIAVIDLNQTDIDETVQLIEGLGVKAKGYNVNVAIEEQVVNLFDTIVSDFSTLDGVINNAGITRDGLLLKIKDGEVTGKMSLQQWQSVIDVNLTGVFLVGREAAERMIKLNVNEGVIVNISSISRHGSFGQTNYSATKAGVIAMTEVWSKELTRYNIRTGAVAPGTINTDMIAAMKPEARERLVKAVPLNRLGEPENIAQAVTFIFENNYFTGRVIEVDGGLR